MRVGLGPCPRQHRAAFLGLESVDASVESTCAAQSDILHCHARYIVYHLNVSCPRYLQKKTKSGQWQRRWFETNGVFLTYYKVRGVCLSVCV